MSKKEDLYAELKRQKEKYAPFLENHAPEIKELSEKIYLSDFVLDGEKIKIPHYGGLCGYNKQVYETEFELAKIDPDKAYYVCFKGANTMGFEQQDVMNGNIGQLIDDILLAKICNMNFLRLTQRPVQDKVYEYCDKLGLMTQTDLPLFGCMRRTNLTGEYTVRYEMNDMACECSITAKACGVNYVSNAEFIIDKVNEREQFTLKAILLDKDGKPLTYEEQTIEVFTKPDEPDKTQNEIIFDLQPGEYEIAGETVRVKPCGMLPVHFVSRKTGHKAVQKFKEKDFSYWYDKDKDMITPILYNTFEADGFTPILTSGNTDENGVWHEVTACAEKVYNGKRYIICNVDLRCENPVALLFWNELKML